MGAMHIRNGNIEAADVFWRMLELSPTKPDFIEPTAMHTIALIGSNHAERGVRQGRQMFARIRDMQSGTSKSKMEIIEQIDEAIEVMGYFMMRRGIFLPPRASMELMWTMIENGGLLPSITQAAIARIGPECVHQLSEQDIALALHVQSYMLPVGEAGIHDIAQSGPRLRDFDSGDGGSTGAENDCASLPPSPLQQLGVLVASWTSTQLTTSMLASIRLHLLLFGLHIARPGELLVMERFACFQAASGRLLCSFCSSPSCGVHGPTMFIKIAGVHNVARVSSPPTRLSPDAGRVEELE